MNNISARKYLPSELLPFISEYLVSGRKEDNWKIESVYVKDNYMESEVSLSSSYISKMDSGGFHLSIYTALEFCSQLLIIYGHLYFGFTHKITECWMVKSSIDCKRAIRSNNVLVKMKCEKIFQRFGHSYTSVIFEISDVQNGLFNIALTGVMPFQLSTPQSIDT